MTALWRNAFVHALAALLALVWSQAVAVRPARAFPLSDGARETCYDARGNPVQEIIANGPQQYTGFTTIMQRRWVIIWDPAKLRSLPPEAYDFIFFHECAHANGHLDELSANCQGLIAMRDANRSSARVERRLAQFHASLGYMGPQYGRGDIYWAATVRCADRESGSGDDEAQDEDEPRDRDRRGGLSTRCRFEGGPRAGQIQDYRGRAGPLPVGTPCQDGMSSWGRVVP